MKAEPPKSPASGSVHGGVLPTELIILSGGWHILGYIFPDSAFKHMCFKEDRPPFREIEEAALPLVQACYPDEGLTQHDLLVVNCMGIHDPALVQESRKI